MTDQAPERDERTAALKREPAECGTYAGVQRHKRRGERVCGFCAAAAAEYVADYRRKNPEVLTNQRRQAKRRQTALRILAVRHAREFSKILEEIR